MGICTKFLDLWDAKIEKNIHQRKIITYKTVFTWFGNLPTSTELQGFHYSQGKNTLCGSTIFLSLKKGHKKPKLQNNSFYILHTKFTMGYKNGPNFFFPRGVAPRTPRRLVHEYYGLGLLAQASALCTKSQKIFN